MNVEHCWNYTDSVRPEYSEEKTCPSPIKKNQLDAQLILGIFRQPRHVSGVSRPTIRRLYWNQSNQNNRHLKRIISTNCCIHMVVPP